jgi:nucleoid-associated protein YgaU
MKLNKYIAGIFTLLLFFAVSVSAQENKEMTEEEWQAEMNRLTQKKADLTAELNSLQNDVNSLKTKFAGMQTYEECADEAYALVGATSADVENFKQKVDALNAKIQAKESPKADRQAELDALKANKLSALPMFYDKVHNQMQRALDAWQEKPKEILYTVVKGDHLWKIAGKKEHYANSFAWPKIYQANRDQIKNPDLIYPKQVFKIPNLTDEEKAHYDKARKNYKPAPMQN